MKKIDFPTISGHQTVHEAIQKLNIEKLDKALDFGLLKLYNPNTWTCLFNANPSRPLSNKYFYCFYNNFFEWPYREIEVATGDMPP